MLGKVTCQTFLLQAQCLLGYSLAAPQQGEQSSPGDTAGISCSPRAAVQSHSREEGQCSSQEGKSRRSGQDQAQGKSQPGGDFSQLFSLQSSPSLQSLLWTWAPNPLEQDWRVCWYSNTPDSAKTKMQLYLLGHAKCLQENLKPT